jgi:hypothetical protein
MSNKIIGAAACGNCAHSIVEGGKMLCALNPPTNTAIFVVTMDDKTQQLIPNVLGWVSAYPAVNPERKCGQHKRQVLTIDDTDTKRLWGSGTEFSRSKRE